MTLVEDRELIGCFALASQHDRCSLRAVVGHRSAWHAAERYDPIPKRRDKMLILVRAKTM